MNKHRRAKKGLCKNVETALSTFLRVHLALFAQKVERAL